MGTVQKLGPWSEKGGVGNTMSPRGGGVGGQKALGKARILKVDACPCACA